MLPSVRDSDYRKVSARLTVISLYHLFNDALFYRQSDVTVKRGYDIPTVRDTKYVK